MDHREEFVLPLIGYRPCIYISFALDVLYGIFAFGETVRRIDIFWNSSYMGRFTIIDWLDVFAEENNQIHAVVSS